MAAVKRKPTRLRRALGTLGTLAGTLAAIALAGALIFGGTGLIADRAAAVEGPDPAPTPLVQTQPIIFENSYTVPRRFIGQIEPAQQTAMAFEQGGTVVEILADDGDRVAEGQVLSRLDTRLLEAEATRLAATREALEAQAELARRTTERQERLRDGGFASAQALDQASLTLAELTARIAEVEAARTAVSIQIEKAELRAPFDATVSLRSADVGTTVGGGTPVLTLIEDRAPEFRVGVDPRLAAELTEGMTARIDFGPQSVEAVLTALLPDLDPATRTRTALFDLPDAAGVTFGDTGALVIDEVVAEDGAWVPVAALKQGVRGLWTVMTVETTDSPRAVVEAVEILHADDTRAYVRGTFAEGAALITDGPHRIVPGQPLRLEGEG